MLRRYDNIYLVKCLKKQHAQLMNNDRCKLPCKIEAKDSKSFHTHTGEVDLKDIDCIYIELGCGTVIKHNPNAWFGRG